MKPRFSKDFILFLIGAAQASFGASVSAIALSFLVLQITGSPNAMATTLALKILPAIFMPIVATFLDRMSLKPPLIIGFFLRATSLIGLCIGVQLNLVNIYVIYGVALFNGIIETINPPAAMILIPYLLENEQLERGNSLLAMANQGMALVGLLVGGAMVGFFGPSLSILIEGICYAIMVILLFFVSMPKVVGSVVNSFWEDFTLGIKLVKTSKILLIIMITFFLMNAIIAPIQVLMPVHMNSIGEGAKGYGIFMSMIVCGLLVGNAVIAYLGSRFNRVAGIILGWLGSGMAFGGLGTLNSFEFSLFWALVLGFSSAMLSTGITVIMQRIIPDAFRGRIIGVITAIAQAGIPFSFFILSYIVKKITLSEVFFAGTILTILFALFWLTQFRRFSHESMSLGGMGKHPRF